MKINEQTNSLPFCFFPQCHVFTYIYALILISTTMTSLRDLLAFTSTLTSTWRINTANMSWAFLPDSLIRKVLHCWYR